MSKPSFDANWQKVILVDRDRQRSPSFMWPKVCICCGVATSNLRPTTFSYSIGKKSVGSLGIKIPYCHTCCGHLEHLPNATWPFYITIFITILLMILSPKALTMLVLFAGIGTVVYLFAMVIKNDNARRRGILKSTCTTVDLAASLSADTSDIYGLPRFHEIRLGTSQKRTRTMIVGYVYTFSFASQSYATAFLKANTERE